MDERRIPFTEEDERRISGAATWGLIVSITSMATSGIAFAIGAVDLNASSPPSDFMLVLLQPAMAVLFNVWLLQASLAFRKVALTDESDQAHLLAGFRKLRAYFMIQVVLILLGLVVGLIAAVFFMP